MVASAAIMLEQSGLKLGVQACSGVGLVRVIVRRLGLRAQERG
jgi:hypothetical protein